MPTFGGIVVSTSAEATGRRSFNEVIDELARPVNANDSRVRALAADAFRAAVRIMNRKGLWPWEAMEEDVTITSGQRFSSLVSAVKKPLAMHYLDAAGGVRDERISYEPYEVFMERFNQDVQSHPLYYTIPNLFETGQVQWWPTPDADDNARFTFYRVTPAPRAETETVEVPDYAMEAYTAYAWAEFLKRLPETQRPFPIQVAIQEARLAFREISSHVTAPGDRSRDTYV